MKKYNTLFVVIFTVLFVALLTWILPITYLGGEFVTEARNQMGIADLFTYPTFLVYNFVYILVYVLLVGAFYGVLNKTGAYRQVLDGLVKFLKGKEILFTCILVVLLSVIVSFTGFTYEAIIIFPFIIAIVFMLGYDKITASLVTLGPVITGIMGSTFSNAVNGTFNGILNSSSTIVEFTDLIWAKLAILLVTNALLVIYIIFYSKRNKVTKVEESIFIPEKTKEEKKKWPLITALIVTLVILVVSTINWTNAFQITFFSDILEKVKSLTIGGYTIWERLLGNVVAFGSWTYNEYFVFLFIMIIVIKLIYHVKFEELFDGIFDGIKNYLYAAGVMLLAYTVLICTSNHPVILTILKPLLVVGEEFNSLLLGLKLALSTFVSALFSTDFGFHNYTILPLTYVTTFIKDTEMYAICGFITQMMNGLAMLVAPTSAVLLFNLSSLKINYLEWLKKIWILFLAFLVVIVATIIIVLLIL